MAINKVTLIGNIGKLETASTSNGQQMAKVSLATSESWRDKQTGEKKEHRNGTELLFTENLLRLLDNIVM